MREPWPKIGQPGIKGSLFLHFSGQCKSRFPIPLFDVLFDLSNTIRQYISNIFFISWLNPGLNLILSFVPGIIPTDKPDNNSAKNSTDEQSGDQNLGFASGCLGDGRSGFRQTLGCLLSRDSSAMLRPPDL